MTNNTVKLLSEVEKAAAFGRDSVSAVLRHVDNTRLRRELSQSRNSYSSVCDDAKNSLASIGCRAGSNPQSMKMMMRTAVNAHLNRKRDTSAAAKMMIQGCTMGNIELLKAIHENLLKQITFLLFHLCLDFLILFRQFLFAPKNNVRLNVKHFWIQDQLQ